MQHKLQTRHPLLDERGHLIEAGWATAPILDYNRSAVKKDGTALKEWEYFIAVKDDSYAAAVTSVSAGPGRMITIHFLDFKGGKSVCCTVPFMSSDDENVLPNGIFSDFCVDEGTAYMKCAYSDGTGQISAFIEDFEGTGAVSVELKITVPTRDLTVITVPYADPERFYYNCKANCMPVEGYIEFEGRRYTFSPETSMATYDWGRGIWEQVNQWYWGSACALLDGVPFGFNIGHGFGDISQATENMIFYDGTCHKLDQIEFQIPDDKIGDLRHALPMESYLKPWRFVTNDARLDMDFRPVLDRSSGLEVTDGYPAGQHQVFGYFSGVAVLDDGRRLPFKDVFGFAEKVVNVWPDTMEF